MTTFREIWTDLQQPGKPLPYLLIDCAGIEGGATQIPRYIFSDIQCLFVGSLATELADVAPYLGQLKTLNTDVARTVENMLTKYVGVLTALEVKPATGFELSFAQIYRHFRKCNLVQAPDGTKLFFRYYDPRVLIGVTQVFDVTQLDELYGPMDSFIFYNSNKNYIKLIRYPKNIQPNSEKIVISDGAN